jgi:nitrate reductase NapAB chaperone NapD
MRVPLIEVGYCKEEGGWMVVVVTAEDSEVFG